MQTFIDLGNDVNTLYPDFMKKFALQVKCINISRQKIDDSKLDTFDMVITSFLVEDNERRSCFFKETFLLANFNIYIVLRIPLFTLNNIESNFL